MALTLRVLPDAAVAYHASDGQVYEILGSNTGKRCPAKLLNLKIEPLMPDNAVRLLALDSYGTLFDLKRGLGEAVEAAGLPAQLAETWAQAVRAETRQRTSPDRFIPFPQLVAECLRSAAPQPLSPSQQESLLAAWKTLPLFPDVKEGLQRWQDSGATAWMITNGDLDGIQALLEHHDLLNLISGVVSAEAVEAYKPARELYLQASASSGAMPGQIVMASALQHDLAGARAAGLRTAWIQREKQLWNESGQSPQWTTDDLPSLITRLQPLLPRPEPGEMVW